MALSKNRIKYIRSLKDKKHRMEHGTFVAEGVKLVSELLTQARCQFVAALPDVINSLPLSPDTESIIASPDELQRATLMKTSPQAIGVFYNIDERLSSISFDNNIHLILDGVQDPGNMGTIVRLADWFGIEHIFCSPDTADIYNPKTVQATMGAIARVGVHYTDVAELLSKHRDRPIYGTFLDGNNIYNEVLTQNGFVVMGSEGRGISPEVKRWITRRLYIPNFPADRPTSESLNVAVATAIVCSTFRQRG